MSSSVAATSSQPVPGAAIYAGAPNLPQLPAAVSAQPPNAGVDTYGPSPEALAPPLMPPNMPPDGDDAASTANNFANAQGTGMAVVAGVAGFFMVASCLGIPVLKEITGSRIFELRKLQQETLEHAVREIDRSASDSTLHWVRELEKRDVDPAVVELLAAEMKNRWDAYAGARKTGGAAEALEQVRALDIPLVEAGKHGPRVATEKTQRSSIGSKAAFTTSLLYNRYLNARKELDQADRDNLRFAQTQSTGYVAQLLGDSKSHQSMIDRGGRAASRVLEFDSKILNLHEQAVSRFIKMMQIGSTPEPQTAAAKNVPADFRAIRPEDFKLDARSGSIKPALHRALAASDQYFAQTLAANAKLPAFARTVPLEKLGFTSNLADKTFAAPRGADAIRKCMEQFAKDGKLVLSMKVSAEILDLIHDAPEHARHLHPSSPGLKTAGRNHEDWKKVRLVWEYAAPKTGELHPEKIKLTDGRLVAAWLTSEEHSADVKQFAKHEARSQDVLGGNQHALHGTFFRRLFRGICYRFKSYGVGIKEGLSTPRYNGIIAASLLVTGLAISSGLYCLVYAVDDAITMHGMPPAKKNKKKIAQQAAAAQTALPPAASAQYTMPTQYMVAAS